MRINLGKCYYFTAVWEEDVDDSHAQVTYTLECDRGTLGRIHVDRTEPEGVSTLQWMDYPFTSYESDHTDIRKNMDLNIAKGIVENRVQGIFDEFFGSVVIEAHEPF